MGFNLVNLTDGGEGTSGFKRPDVVEYNKKRINPLLGVKGSDSKSSKPLCILYTNGQKITTNVGSDEFARNHGIPIGTLSYCISTGKSCKKYNIERVWRP